MKTKKTKYQRKVRVTLTASQWLTVQCALWDAIEMNSIKHPALTGDIRRVYQAIFPQTDAAINEADAECKAELEQP